MNDLKSNLMISPPCIDDLSSINKVFQESITDAFIKEGLGDLKTDITHEIELKIKKITDSLTQKSDTYFLIAKKDKRIVGTISYGACNEDIKKGLNNTNPDIGEIGSIYVLPEYQNQGIGSMLIKEMIAYLNKKNIKQFYLDSGFKRAQNRWMRKFGNPYKVIENYFGSGADNMIWLVSVSEFIDESKIEKGDRYGNTNIRGKQSNA